MKKVLLVLISIGIFSVGNVYAQVQPQSPMEKMADELAEAAQLYNISAEAVVERNKDPILRQVTEAVRYRIH